MKVGLSLKTNALMPGQHKSTFGPKALCISRLRDSSPRQAQSLCQQRSHARRNAIQIYRRTKTLVTERLNLQRSTEQIAASLPFRHDTIYHHIYADKEFGGVRWKQLRCQKKKRKHYAIGRDRRVQIVGRRPIAERPACVEKSRKVGYLEGGTVIGAGHKQAIVTLVERESGFAALAHVIRITSDSVSQAIITSYAPLALRVKTVTYYNRKEFSDHTITDTTLKSTAYFAYKFTRWQRGSIENFNGLLRQCILKKRPLSTVAAEEIKMIQDRINHRPRKRSGFKTPYEVFYQLIKRVALRT